MFINPRFLKKERQYVLLHKYHILETSLSLYYSLIDSKTFICTRLSIHKDNYYKTSIQCNITKSKNVYVCKKKKINQTPTLQHSKTSILMARNEAASQKSRSRHFSVAYDLYTGYSYGNNYLHN